ncbi:unnamed protein product [Amoebophrya sp. A120]|nr:unnamed protein product [Amoebophrya sp. A120]|eukprot:GSA120T00011714001.1
MLEVDETIAYEDFILDPRFKDAELVTFEDLPPGAILRAVPDSAVEATEMQQAANNSSSQRPRCPQQAGRKKNVSSRGMNNAEVEKIKRAKATALEESNMKIANMIVDLWTGYLNKKETTATPATCTTSSDDKGRAPVAPPAQGASDSNSDSQETDHATGLADEFAKKVSLEAEQNDKHVRAEDVEYREDPTDGYAYCLKDFVVEYGGSMEDPPKQWLGAKRVDVDDLVFEAVPVSGASGTTESSSAGAAQRLQNGSDSVASSGKRTKNPSNKKANNSKNKNKNAKQNSTYKKKQDCDEDYSVPIIHVPDVRSDEQEHRVDLATDPPMAFPLWDFLLEYGGSVTNPPREWVEAPTEEEFLHLNRSLSMHHNEEEPVQEFCAESLVENDSAPEITTASSAPIGRCGQEDALLDPTVLPVLHVEQDTSSGTFIGPQRGPPESAFLHQEQGDKQAPANNLKSTSTTSENNHSVERTNTPSVRKQKEKPTLGMIRQDARRRMADAKVEMEKATEKFLNAVNWYHKLMEE